MFVTPEYNHSTSGALKNAIDYLSRSGTTRRPASSATARVGGTRAVEHLRADRVGELQIADVRPQVALSLFTDFENYSTFTPGPQHEAAAETMFDQLEAWTAAMKSVRAGVYAAA